MRKSLKSHSCQKLLLCCTNVEISLEAYWVLLFVAVGQFQDVAPFTEPSLNA